jgi:hypothetical protein
VNVRWIPLDPPWLIVPVVAGILLGAASIWNESWSIAVTFGGWLLAFLPALIGVDRWYERTHPRRPRQRPS